MYGDRLRFAVEDRFLILKLWESSAMLPDGQLARTLAQIFASLYPDYSLVCDAQGIELITTDIEDFLSELKGIKTTVIIDSSRSGWFKEHLRSIGLRSLTNRVLPLESNAPDFSFTDFPLPEGPGYSINHSAWQRWRESMDEVDTNEPPSRLEFSLIETIESLVYEHPEGWDYDKFIDFFTTTDDFRRGQMHQWYYGNRFADVVYARRWLEQKIPVVGRNSLLTQFTLNLEGDSLLLVPYHGHAIYPVEAASELILARPSVLAKKTNMLFASEAEEFARLLSALPSEHSIQKFLVDHPAIFHSLGYIEIHPQVILQREDGKSLRPDFILQPIGDDWCDILDLKLPSDPLIVGRRDRKALAAGIHQLAAQLREYAAYFDNPAYAKRIEERYGIRCYKPRLIGVVGHDPSCTDQRQMRRAMTAYADVKLITFDRLIRLARERILI